MNVLKGLAVALLCFLLFLSLSIFGIAFTVQSTALNPDFVTSEINRLDVSSFVNEFMQIESPPEVPELEEVIHETIGKLEPVVKERLDDTIHAVYDYFPNDTENLELNSVLRENFLTADFAASVIDNIDISELAGIFIRQQLTEAIPLEIENLDEFLLDAIDEAEPAIKAELVAVADPVFDYILGQSQTLDASISLVEVKEVLKENIVQSLLESPPPELATLPEKMQAEMVNAFYDEMAAQIPSDIPLDESIIGADVPANFDEALNNVEETLGEASIYVGYFQTVYVLLIVFMILMVIGVVLIIRDVKIITRRLGTPMISYGAIQYAAIWASRYLMRGQIPFPPEIPEFVKAWVFQFIDNLMRPLEIFSLALLITGVVLVVISYVYKRRQEPEPA